MAEILKPPEFRLTATENGDPAVKLTIADHGEATEMVGAILLGFICGVIARILTPRDAFRKMNGPTSWAISIGLGLLGALLGYVIFTLGMGIGDTDIFDWGGFLSALIGTIIVVPIGTAIIRSRNRKPPNPAAPTSIR